MSPVPINNILKVLYAVTISSNLTLFLCVLLDASNSPVIVICENEEVSLFRELHAFHKIFESIVFVNAGVSECWGVYFCLRILSLLIGL